MASAAIKKANGEGKTIYHRYPEGNDIVSTEINENAYWGTLKTAPENVDYIIDGKTYYYKTYDREKNLVWQKIYLGGAK